jgi:hypothetical protein
VKERRKKFPDILRCHKVKFYTSQTLSETLLNLQTKKVNDVDQKIMYKTWRFSKDVLTGRSAARSL